VQTRRLLRRFVPLLAAVPLLVLYGAPPAAAATTWTLVASPNPHVNLNGLNGVFARTATDAWAVGVFGETREEDEQGGLILHWNGTAWSQVIGPNPQFRNEVLNAVHGVAANDVWAVGGLATAINQLPKVPWALHWNGTAWSEVPVPTGPNPGGTGRGGLRDVKAINTNNVWAVGKSPGVTALVEHWDGTSWTVAPTPTVKTALNALAVVSSTNIWAVGDGLVNPDGSKTALIMHYDGRSWQTMPNQVSVPSTFVAHNGLKSITALSATDIWAVGSVTDRLSVTRPLIQHYDGRTWTRVAAAPAPPNSTHYSLSGVAAVSATDIYAVGGVSFNDLTEASIVERWNGRAWSQVTVPHSTAADDGLNGVAVTPGGSPIWAVGQSFDTNARKTLILRGQTS
jgi:hypothetical protein